jgi:sulfofructose kinase
LGKLALPVTKAFDILGLGCVAVDDLLYVAHYPEADSKQEVRRRQRQCGGLTATALVAAARLGAQCAYAGTLGRDELSVFAAHRLAAENVDLSYLRRRDGVRPICSTIVVDETQRTRTILFDLSGAAPATPDWPPDEAIGASRVLFVDHLGVDGMTRAAQVAATAGIPVVADFESQSTADLAGLCALVDHPIFSYEFARRWTGQGDPSAAALGLWTPHRQAVVVTWGARGCWYVGADAPNEARHQPAFRVEVVDTTGCGDVFHGAYAAGLAQGLALPDRIRLAAAVAALKATRPGGQTGIPTRAEVEAFLSQQGSA